MYLFYLNQETNFFVRLSAGIGKTVYGSVLRSQVEVLCNDSLFKCALLKQGLQSHERALLAACTKQAERKLTQAVCHGGSGR
jgi:hypothetical protein